MSDLALSPAAASARAPGRFKVIRAVAAKEWLEMRRDRRLVALFAFAALLMLAALGFGAAENARLSRERAAAAEADRELWTSQGAKNPHAAAHFGQYAFKPESPLALADPGVDPYVGTAVWLEAHKQNEAQFRPARDGGTAARLGGLSLAFILQVIAPLVVLLTGFASFAGERESGALKQLLSLGARPGDLLAGKALALFGAAAALLAPAFICAFVAVALLADPSKLSLADQFLRLAVLTLGYGVYLAGFAFLALGVSALARDSRAALVALLAFWLVNAFVAPRLSADLARALAPTPSAQEFRAAIARDKAKTFGHDETHPAFVAFRDETLKKYGVSRVEDLPVSFRGLTLRRDDENGYAIYDKHFGALQAAFDRQDALRTAAGFVFPLLAMQPFSMALAGADSRAQFDFATAAEAHRRLIQNEVSDNIIHFQRDESYVAGPELWRRIAAFSYSSPKAGFALAGAREAIAGLLGWLALTAVFARVAVRRLRPL
ncbi:ABC transporter permease subunit [Methylocystis echinoides]|uniref:ABC transporter permease subunit n=1 Tax=Methylocystis echinoides TaxID=29468 RepID=UPI00342DF10C